MPKVLLILILLVFQCLFADGKVDPSKREREQSIISRTIDASDTFREFPDLTSYWNTSVQKAPSPVLADIAAEEFGKAKIVRCWLNLDELWDYRNRQFTFDFKIGVDKYKGIAEKYRETWNGQVEAPSTFYQYLEAFSKNSDEIMLTIRRYERDVLDKKLPISQEDWKKAFKTGLKHYKEHFPSIRYIEVGNEYSLKAFMDATAEEYYQFFQLGYQAVNEVNEELNLKGKDRILVGGPVVTDDVLKKLDQFFKLFTSDPSKNKRIDFISWHDYHKEVQETSNREADLKLIIKKYNLSNKLPLFITEHDPYHFEKDGLEYHFLNTAYLPKTLYFASISSPRVKIFPWVLFHRIDRQTKFMWFTGSNEVNATKEEIHMQPLGCSVKFLSMLKGKEINVENSIENNDLVLTSKDEDQIVVEVVNYDEQRDVALKIEKLKLPGHKKNGKVHLTKYLIDSNHSNCLTNPEYSGGIEKVEDLWLDIKNDSLVLVHSALEKNGLVLWKLSSSE